ncbi:CRISPR-associated endoribonuclease Cas6 [Desulforamulus ruminis]|uniref:CRISPR-associated endoribonuclease n=1 Tax=Desulforamulus ruminis (strain ATCC 23193 / DSM 2154 / NCIMB 8452 / DL) TaxID=696281 RepID=F6DTP0_DESRL|nr:CRISPR-associated endoribonuclease Cas6 [Desulforamulus ruminis]AEG61214.1 CRISPR-associated protein Cas6 [Desulforamulus ruminis DSM 2154]
MHLFITLTPQKELELPVHYNHLVQAAVYGTIDPELAVFLHDKGYESGSRRFKLFTFSRVSGRFEANRDKNTLRFTGDVSLTLSSPVNDFCQSIANGFLTRGQIRLGSHFAEVKAVTVRQFTVRGEKVLLRTLSPVVAYSTMRRLDGRKYTCYFQPGDPDYSGLIENNLRKKYQAFFNREAPPGEVKVRKTGNLKMNLVNYKGTIIKGYSGLMELTGPTELLQMAVDGGLGGKNAQGFGCVEMVVSGNEQF